MNDDLIKALKDTLARPSCQFVRIDRGAASRLLAVLEAPAEGAGDLTIERVLSRICDAQKQHYGNATGLHLAMLDLCIDGRAALALRARSSAPEAREGEVVGPDSFSAEGKFFLAVDYLTLMTWRWGESCGIDSVGWDDTGDSYNQSCRDDHRKARRAVVDAFHAAVAEKIAAHPAAPSADKLRIAVEALDEARENLIQCGDHFGAGQCADAVSLISTPDALKGDAK